MHIVIQVYDTLLTHSACGKLIGHIKTVSDMTYYVSSGTLNL